MATKARYGKKKGNPQPKRPERVTFSNVSKAELNKYIGCYTLTYVKHEQHRLEHLFLTTHGWDEAADAWKSYWDTSRDDVNFPTSVHHKLQDLLRYMQYVMSVRYVARNTLRVSRQASRHVRKA